MKTILALALLCLCAVPVFAKPHSKKVIDPDVAYRNNCMRCHSEVRGYSPRMTKTIVNHMRVRANMTAEEAQAILQYLTENASAKSVPAPYGQN